MSKMEKLPELDKANVELIRKIIDKIDRYVVI